MADDQTRTWIVAEEEAGTRLDVWLAERLEGVSRARIRRIVDAGGATVGGAIAKPSLRVAAGDIVFMRLDAYEPKLPEPEPTPLDILYEDADLAVVNKLPGMVVHPGRGCVGGTLVGALAHHFQSLSTIGGGTRPGIIHRLDRDTSGAIVVAKNDLTHERIAAQFKARTVEKAYLAIVVGAPQLDRDWIDRPIGHHPHQREKMALRAGHASSRDARTFYEVLERFAGYALVRAEPKTGRTHQIRLHLVSIGCPVLCDRLYGGRSEITAGELLLSAATRSERRAPTLDPSVRADQVVLNRQALHAWTLRFNHPTTGQRLSFTAPVPADMELVLKLLRNAKCGMPNAE